MTNTKSENKAAATNAPVAQIAPFVVLAGIEGTYMKEEYIATLVVDVPKKGEANNLRVNYTRDGKTFVITDKECVEAFLSKGFNRQIADNESTEDGIAERLQAMSEGFVSPKKKATYQNSLIAPVAVAKKSRISFPFDRMLELVVENKAAHDVLKSLGANVIAQVVRDTKAGKKLPNGSDPAQEWVMKVYEVAEKQAQEAARIQMEKEMEAGHDALDAVSIDIGSLNLG